ncbi:MAG: YiiX/YebB-like N1pC/P60 family cysteine hydrolase [Prevotella sp.]|nr:YiiX/YebB-like N1pC/P60 family cysteine hydrolase [Prevotella sp.]
MSSSTSICRLLPSHWDMALPIGRIWFVCLAMILVSCGEREEERSILPDDFALCAGDVVFRRGEGITSRAVLATDANGNYSHVGIVVDYAERRMIVHAVPGEPDFEGDVDRVKMDTPEKFFSYKNASKGEVCRLRDSSIAQRAANVALRIFRKGTPFDDKFDDKDTSKMYCTELVVYAYRHAGIDLTEGRRHEIDLPIIKTACIFPSDIYASRHLKSIIKFHQ